ncbi:MAG: transposase family protein [Cyclobacteriaceae bacterium]
MKNTSGIHGIWRSIKYFTITKPISNSKELYISAGLAISLFNFNKKTIHNGLINHSKNRSKYWMAYKDRNAINIKYESIPVKTLNKHKLPLSSEGMLEILLADQAEKQDINVDYEIKSLQMDLDNIYENRWPPFLKAYEKRIPDKVERIRYAKAHALIDAIIKLHKSKWPTAVIFHVYKAIITNRLDELESPVFRTLSPVYFWRIIRNASRNGIVETIVHDSLGVPRNHQVKMTGQIKAFIRIQLRHPKRHLIKEVIKRVNKKFNLELSESSIKTFKSTIEKRNILEWYSNGETKSRQNEMPRLTRYLAEAPGEVYEGDFYKSQFICRSKTGEVIRLWLFVVIDVYSKKIVGWHAGRKVSETMAIQAFKMAFTEACFLPEEIIIDNDNIFKRPKFKRFVSRTNTYGVIWTKAFPNMPTWKSNIEGFFGIWQKMVSSQKWYIGESVKSKNKSGNPNDEFVKQLWTRKSDMLNKEEMIEKFSKMFIDYNSKGYGQKKNAFTPNDYFRLYESKRTIKYENWMESQLFWAAKPKKMIRVDGRVELQIQGVKYIFQLKEAEKFFRHKGSYVRVHYDIDDLSKIHLFERRTEKFIGEVSQRLMLTRENKPEILKQHRKELREITSYVRSKRNEDFRLATGSCPLQEELSESLDSKLTRKRMRQIQIENEVSNVIIDE